MTIGIGIPIEESGLIVSDIDKNNSFLSTNDVINSNNCHLSVCKTKSKNKFIILSAIDNLIKGGDLDNAIVVVDRAVQSEQIEKLSSLFNKPSIEVREEGILNNVELRYSNEPARHKLLDVIGDLALIGKRIRGKVIAKKPGHFINTEFAKKISDIIEKEENLELKKKEYEKKAIMDAEQIMNILPHRPPFLFIDKILKISENSITGLKYVSPDEPYFKGHFPGRPVMPGVLQIEAMAQVGGVLVLSTFPDPENYLTFFGRIENAKFKRPVEPGDTLIFELELLSPIRRGISHMLARAYVDGCLLYTSDAADE